MIGALDVGGSYEDILKSVFSAPIAAKAWLATGAIALAIVQVFTAARIYGRLKNVIRIPDRAVSRIHRWSGRFAFLLTLPIVFHCVAILGFQSGDARVLVHSVVGSFFYGIFAAKILIVRDQRFPGWVLPLAGGVLFFALVVLWYTSSYWYFTDVRFGF